MAILDFVSVDVITDKKATLQGKLKCFFSFHHWVYAPHCIEISTRFFCRRKGCSKWKDYNGVIFSDTGRRYGWREVWLQGEEIVQKKSEI